MSLFKNDYNLILKAIEMYDILDFMYEILNLISLKFDTILLPLHLNVFDLLLKSFPSS
jgi:hypothetical protein